MGDGRDTDAGPPWMVAPREMKDSISRYENGPPVGRAVGHGSMLVAEGGFEPPTKGL